MKRTCWRLALLPSVLLALIAPPYGGAATPALGGAADHARRSRRPAPAPGGATGTHMSLESSSVEQENTVTWRRLIHLARTATPALEPPVLATLWWWKSHTACAARASAQRCRS